MRSGKILKTIADESFILYYARARARTMVKMTCDSRCDEGRSNNDIYIYVYKKYIYYKRVAVLFVMQNSPGAFEKMNFEMLHFFLFLRFAGGGGDGGAESPPGLQIIKNVCKFHTQRKHIVS